MLFLITVCSNHTVDIHYENWFRVCVCVCVCVYAKYACVCVCCMLSFISEQWCLVVLMCTLFVSCINNHLYLDIHVFYYVCIVESIQWKKILPKKLCYYYYTDMNDIFQQTLKRFLFLFGQQFCVLEMFTVTFHTDITHTLLNSHPGFQANFEGRADNGEGIIDNDEDVPKVDKFHTIWETQFLPKTMLEKLLHCLKCTHTQKNLHSSVTETSLVFFHSK